MTELLKLASGIIVKRDDLANKYETLETATAYDYYISATNMTDTFDTYMSFSEQILADVGLTQEQIQAALKSKSVIPQEYRQAIVNLQREYVLANFQEKNEYYRTLNGYPDVDNITAVYIYDTIPNVDTSKPIHMMTNSEIVILNGLGKITELMTKYPKYKYLKYLGDNRIDIITARSAKKFDILRYDYISNSIIRHRFFTNYELSRAYILNNYYKKRLSLDNEYFDAYIGFLIVTNALIMTIN